MSSCDVTLMAVIHQAVSMCQAGSLYSILCPSDEANTIPTFWMGKNDTVNSQCVRRGPKEQSHEAGTHDPVMEDGTFVVAFPASGMLVQAQPVRASTVNIGRMSETVLCHDRNTASAQ